MTAPICHGTAGGCHLSMAHDQVHTDDCPTMRVAPATLPCGQCHQDGVVLVGGVYADHAMSPLDRRRCPSSGMAATHPATRAGRAKPCPTYTCDRVRPPAKRTMGQCMGLPACVPIGSSQFGGVPYGHAPDCPALYPLQRQPGDAKDALTRLVALLREVPEDPGSARVAAALDLISEAREEHRAALREADECYHKTHGDMLHWKRQHATASDELARSKTLCQTLTLQQSEVRQQAFRDMAAEMDEMSNTQRTAHLIRILDAAKESTS